MVSDSGICIDFNTWMNDGIVADSDPSREFDESVNKARAVAVALQYAERGLT